MTQTSPASFPGGMNIKVRGSRENDWCNCVSSVHSKDQQSISEATKYLGPRMSACSHRRACGITEGFLHLSHHFPLLCSTPTCFQKSCQEQVWYQLIVGSLLILAITSCPGREMNLAIKAPFHLCLCIWHVEDSECVGRRRAEVRDRKACMEPRFWHFPHMSLAGDLGPAIPIPC